MGALLDPFVTASRSDLRAVVLLELDLQPHWARIGRAMAGGGPMFVFVVLSFLWCFVWGG